MQKCYIRLRIRQALYNLEKEALSKKPPEGIDKVIEGIQKGSYQDRDSDKDYALLYFYYTGKLTKLAEHENNDLMSFDVELNNKLKSKTSLKNDKQVNIKGISKKFSMSGFTNSISNNDDIKTQFSPLMDMDNNDLPIMHFPNNDYDNKRLIKFNKESLLERTFSPSVENALDRVIEEAKYVFDGTSMEEQSAILSYLASDVKKAERENRELANKSNDLRKINHELHDPRMRKINSDESRHLIMNKM